MAAGRDNRIPSLDGLRGISILFVVWAHLCGTGGFPVGRHQLQALGDLGNLGVRVFFVISGYLITRLLLEERARTGTTSLGAFYLRRTFRIFPAALVFIGLIAIATAFGWFQTPVHDFVHALTYTMNFHALHPERWPLSHLWSLSVEEQFYLLWPPILLLLGNRRALGVAGAMLLISPAFRYGTYRLWPESEPLLTYAFPAVADSIATGCLLAGLEDRLDVPTWKRFATSPWFAVVPLVAITANTLVEHPLIDFVVAKGCMNVAIALVIHRAVRWPTGAMVALLNWRPLTALGTLSYSLYLWQQPFLNRDSDAPWCRFPLNLALASLAAFLSYRFVERPLLRARVRWFAPPSARARSPLADP